MICKTCKQKIIIHTCTYCNSNSASEHECNFFNDNTRYFCKAHHSKVLFIINEETLERQTVLFLENQKHCITILNDKMYLYKIKNSFGKYKSYTLITSFDVDPTITPDTVNNHNKIKAYLTFQ